MLLNKSSYNHEQLFEGTKIEFEKYQWLAEYICKSIFQKATLTGSASISTPQTGGSDSREAKVAC